MVEVLAGMSKVLFICRVKPWNIYKVTPDRNVMIDWWISNVDSAGTREVKRVRWEQLPDAMIGVKDAKPRKAPLGAAGAVD